MHFKKHITAGFLLVFLILQQVPFLHGKCHNLECPKCILSGCFFIETSGQQMCIAKNDLNNFHTTRLIKTYPKCKDLSPPPIPENPISTTTAPVIWLTRAPTSPPTTLSTTRATPPPMKLSTTLSTAPPILSSSTPSVPVLFQTPRKANDSIIQQSKIHINHAQPPPVSSHPPIDQPPPILTPKNNTLNRYKLQDKIKLTNSNIQSDKIHINHTLVTPSPVSSQPPVDKPKLPALQFNSTVSSQIPNLQVTPPSLSQLASTRSPLLTSGSFQPQPPVPPIFTTNNNIPPIQYKLQDKIKIPNIPIELTMKRKLELIAEFKCPNRKETLMEKLNRAYCRTASLERKTAQTKIHFNSMRYKYETCFNLDFRYRNCIKI